MKLPSPSVVTPFPFIEELKDYSLPTFRADLMAALAVALMAIPQSIAYSLLAGLPPTAGLYAAIFGTLLTASFGSSRHLISGPTTGVALLIQTTIADLLYTYFSSTTGAARDALVMHLLTQVILVMGLVQVGLAFFNVAKLLQFVSRPVTLGYFAGIASAIVVSQSFAIAGIAAPAGDQPVLLRAVGLLGHLLQISWPTLLVGTLSFAALAYLQKRIPNWPYGLFMLAGASLLAWGINVGLGQETVATLGDLNLAGRLLPKLKFPLLDLYLLSKIFPGALAVALLALLEMYSVSRQYAVMGGYRTSVNQDVFGLGVGNLTLSFLSGAMPASGSATRTALGYRLGAKTRGAAMLAALLTAGALIVCWPLIGRIPPAALAALLFATVPSLVPMKEVRLCVRATKEDAWIFFLTFTACLLFTLDIAFFIGILLSIASYLRKSSVPHLVEYAFNAKGRLMVVNLKEDAHRKVRIIGIGGDLYFATAEVFQNALQTLAEDPDVQAIVLRLNNVYHMDASICLSILRLHETLHETKRHLVISGLSEEVWHVFHRAGLVQHIGLDNLYFSDESNPQFSTWKGCLRAQELIHKT